MTTGIQGGGPINFAVCLLSLAGDSEWQGCPGVTLWSPATPGYLLSRGYIFLLTYSTSPLIAAAGLAVCPCCARPPWCLHRATIGAFLSRTSGFLGSGSVGCSSSLAKPSRCQVGVMHTTCAQSQLQRAPQGHLKVLLISRTLKG